MSKIIAFVGMAGSGKSVAVEHISNKGYPRVYFGGVIVDGLREAGLEITAENEKRFREEVRAREGKDFVVKRIIKQINDLKESGQHHIIADGIYSWTEYKAMKHAFPGELTVVAILASPSVRHRRLAKRTERPLTGDEATKRDWSEIENIEKGGPIAIADYYIINETTKDEYLSRLDEILNKIDFYN